MQIHRLPALSDNYIFALEDPQHRQVVVIDPAEASPVLDFLAQIGADLVGIWHTHHHGDHIGGNRDLLARFPQAIVQGGAEDRGRLPGQSVYLEDGDQVAFAGREALVLFIPGHTRAHIAYYFAPPAPEQPGDLFCGDTLFGGGCGRLFEGTPQQMQNSLARLRELPDNTRVWCAHEYTLGNLKFALTVEPENRDLQCRWQEVQALRQEGSPTIPSLLGDEKKTNPFLRWDSAVLQEITGYQEPARVFGKLRGMKDLF
ncbi:MAG: hydroxyacylglutathione hydrolase [Cyanobacteriota bacterium]|jgi:hydroxyacylglutathione hydrolase